MKKFGITLGLNASIRKLKSEEISSVLISTEIKPKFIINQIICLIISNYQTTKILCVPNLKLITEEIFGISSLLMIIRNQMLPLIENWVRNKSENYPIPKELIQYYGNKNINEKQDSKNIPEIKIKEIKAGTSNLQKHKSSKESNHNNVINFNDLYLKRPSEKYQRAFIPDNAKNLKPLNFDIVPNKSAEWGNDYISFSGETKIFETKNDNDNNEENDDNMDSKEEYEKDKICLLKVFEKMETKLNINDDIKAENNSEEMKEEKISKEKNKTRANNQESENIEQHSPDLLFVSKNSRKRKRNKNSNLISEQNNSEEKKILEEPVFRYVPVNINKIQGNPNRKKKKKKNKK